MSKGVGDKIMVIVKTNRLVMSTVHVGLSHLDVFGRFRQSDFHINPTLPDLGL